MTTTTLERVDLTTTTTQDSDHDRVRHYAADREQFDRASLGAPFRLAVRHDDQAPQGSQVHRRGSPNGALRGVHELEVGRVVTLFGWCSGFGRLPHDKCPGTVQTTKGVAACDCPCHKQEEK